MNETEDHQSSAKSLSIRAQKKILGTVVNKRGSVKLFIDDKSAHLLDTFYELTLLYTDNKRRAEKLLKYSIKTAIKLLVLIRNGQLTSDQLATCKEFRRKLRLVANTVISFHEVDFTLDTEFLSELLKEEAVLLKEVLRPHLTSKSMERVDQVFAFCSDVGFLQALFTDERYTEQRNVLARDLDDLLNDNIL
ncbi:hypothetical protein RvY_06841 [Ramazzottius varieornatus]|uniref:Tumor necrosis factor alpha-induced protein 8-like protein n=1 Tax=Ramazzottius varieornatus TaxID=947166 RepID=A0A1D1UZY5_RAMVA|nr:hypothetical protein RvY_06841 [Ramazzottius varieornatus]